MNNRQPTDAELEILQVLWRNGPATVRRVNDILNNQRKVGYTTTLKMMQIMTEKKMLKRNADKRSHVYSPVIKESVAQDLMLSKLMKSAFGGSALKLVVSALGNGGTSKKELDKIREFLDRMEERQGGGHGPGE